MPLIAARSVITQALRLIGVAASEQPVQADMAQSGLESLNSLLDAWSTSRTLIWTRPKISLVLVPGKQTYTWGISDPVSDIVGVPPVRLEMCLLTVNGAQQDDWVIGILDQQQYEEGIYLKTMQSTYAEYIYLSNDVPVKTLFVWPVPQGASHTLQLFPWAPLPQYTHWDDVLDFPQGYARLMAFNLAVELGPEYGVEASPTVLRIAAQTKHDLAPLNAPVGRLSYQPGGQPVLSRMAAFYAGRP